MNKSSKDNNLPSPLQEALLRASLLKGEEALKAWDFWKSNADMERPDQGSYRLIPLLYKNLYRLGIDDPLMNKFKGIYRLTWYRNQMLFHNMAGLLKAFHDAGIETMLLKGSSLILLYYKDYGLRPMSDFDVLFRGEQVIEAYRLLGKMGWTPKLRLAERFTEKIFSVRHAYSFENSSGVEFDLHRHILLELSSAGADDIFWNRAVPLRIHDLPVCALDPTDQLLHICIHGSWWNFVPPFRWIADAMMVINNSGSVIDWDRLMAEAQKFRVILPLRNGLSYMHERLYAPVPPEILKGMNAMQVSKAEITEYKYTTKPLSFFTGFMKLWIQHSRLNENKGLIYRTIRFPRFLQYTWGADRLWKIPLYAFIKGHLVISGKINSYKKRRGKIS